MNLRDYITSPSKESGVWISYDGAEFLIAAITRPEYNRALEKHRKGRPLAKLQRDNETAKQIITEALADAVLLDFRGVKDGDSDLAPTRENRLAVLAIPSLREWIVEQASTIANFQAEATAEDAEALKSPSALAH